MQCLTKKLPTNKPVQKSASRKITLHYKDNGNDNKPKCGNNMFI